MIFGKLLLSNCFAGNTISDLSMHKAAALC